MLEGWFPGVRGAGAGAGAKPKTWAKGSHRGGSTADTGVRVHEELAGYRAGAPRESLHPMTLAVLAALDKRGLVIVCGDTLVRSPKGDVATGVDLVVTKDPLALPLQVTLIEVKTGGCGAAGKRFGCGKKHALPPLGAIPQTLQGFAHAQLAATAFLFQCTQPGGAQACEALVVSVTPGGKGPGGPKVQVVPCLQPFLRSGPLPWEHVLVVGQTLVQGRAAALLTSSPSPSSQPLYTMVQQLPWKSSPGVAAVLGLLGGDMATPATTKPPRKRGRPALSKH